MLLAHLNPISIQFKYKFKYQLLPCTPACGYKFHALAVYLLPTFTVPPVGSAFGIKPNICGEQFCRNSQCVKAVGYFHKLAPSWMFDRMFDRIPDANDEMLPTRSGNLSDPISIIAFD